MTSNVFLSKYASLTDEQWLSLLIRSLTEPVIGGVRFPTYPDSTLQQSFVGSSGRSALEEAFVFYQDVKQFARENRAPVRIGSRLLDFGCGWGRLSRFFLKDVLAEDLVGIDVDGACVALCQQSIPSARFESCDVLPPLNMAAGSFDIVYAYSVFSHLSEPVQLAWIKEFARILKPSGLLLVTTLKRAHIQVWANTRTTSPHWAEALAWFEEASAEKAFDSGKLLFCPIGGGGVRTPDFYGEAIVSPDFVRQSWTPYFSLTAYVDDNKRPQALIVAKRN